MQKLNIEMSTRKTLSSSLWPPVDTTIIWSALFTRAVKRDFAKYLNAKLAKCLSRFLIVKKALVCTFNKENALVGAFFGHCEIS